MPSLSNMPSVKKSKYLVVLYGFEKGKRPQRIYEVEATNTESALYEALAPGYTDQIESGDKVSVYSIIGATAEFELQNQWCRV